MTGHDTKQLETAAGFTLIELMVTVAMVAILTSVAFGYYRNAEVRNNRSSAQTYLSTLAAAQQQYFLDNRSYASCTSITTCNTALSTTTTGNLDTFYTVAITLKAGPPPGFTATATPISGSYQASDVTLSIDESGTKTAKDSSGSSVSGIW